MKSKVQPPKVPKTKYFQFIPFALLLNVLLIMTLGRKHTYRHISLPDGQDFPALGGWLYKLLPHTAQMHQDAIQKGQLNIWLGEFAKFTNFMVIEIGFTLFVLLNVVVYYAFGFAKKNELNLIEDYRNPASISKPVKLFTACNVAAVVIGLMIITMYYLVLVPYNGEHYGDQFFGDVLMYSMLLVWVGMLWGLMRNLRITQKALRLGQLPVPVSYISAVGIVRNMQNRSLDGEF